MRSNRLACFLACLGAGCTLTTEAGDRTITDLLDLDFTMLGMSSAHGAGETIDVALVAQQDEDRQALRARARIILPAPSAGTASIERLVLGNAVSEERLKLLFYVDTDNDQRFDLVPLEHNWQEDVPKNGELSFRHSILFEEFDQDKPSPIGGDLVLELPALARTMLGTACFEARVRATIEVGVFVDPDGARVQVGYFKTYRDNGVPGADIRLRGIVDRGSTHGIQVTVDGVRGPMTPVGPATAEGLTVPFATWFPIDEGSRLACTGVR